MILNTGDRFGASMSPFAFLQQYRQTEDIRKAPLLNKSYVVSLLQIISTIVFIIPGYVCSHNKIHSFPNKCNLKNHCKIRKTWSRTIGHNHAFWVPCSLTGDCVSIQRYFVPNNEWQQSNEGPIFMHVSSHFFSWGEGSRHWLRRVNFVSPLICKLWNSIVKFTKCEIFLRDENTEAQTQFQGNNPFKNVM